MDIFDSEIRDLTEQGVEFVVTNPDPAGEAFGTGEGKAFQPFTLTLLGMNSKPVQEFNKRFRKLHPSKVWSEEEQAEYTAGMAKAATTGWTGSKVEFTPESAGKLFAKQEWLSKKVFAFILDGDRFLRS